MKYSNKEDIESQRGYLVVKSNDLIRKARYDLGIQEQKLLTYIISKIKPSDTELQEYTLSCKDFCQVCGIDYTGGANYASIKKTLQGLRDKSFWVIDENGHENLVGWLQKVKINRGSSKITVKLDDEMQKYIIGLQDNFTQYTLLSTLPMKSTYSFRMYELLKSYSFTGGYTFDLDELKRLLMAENIYSNFKDFRRYVLETSTKEINNYTDIEVNWEPIYSGRKVIKVRFYIKQRDGWGCWYAYARASEQIEGQISMFDYDYYQ